MRLPLSDLTGPSISQLSQGHYPLRPDAGSSLYTSWMHQVARSVDIYQGVPVTILGIHNYGTLAAAYSQSDFNWTGFVQAASGFDVGSNFYPYANTPATLYGGYEAETYVPNPQGCWGQSCDDSSYWAGSGGVYAWNGGSPFSPALLQNGFQFLFGTTLELFSEFYPSPVNAFVPPNVMTAGDQFFLEGYDGDASCTYTTGTPVNGCFIWEDITQNWVLTDTEVFPSGATWLPATVEYISEWHPGFGVNNNVSGEAFVGTALDTSGTWHDDPGSPSATDPYGVLYGQDANSNYCGTPTFASGTGRRAMVISTSQCGPN